MRTEKEIGLLPEKYLDGNTTTAEEQALRAYFSEKGDSIPEEWRPYRAMFAYVAGETGLNRPTASRRTRHRGLGYAALAAAAAAVTAALILSAPESPANFAAIDGRTYTCDRVVRAEALNALQLVSSGEDDTFGALDAMN